MSLSAALQHLFPGIAIGTAGTGECEIEKGGDGVTRISSWNRPEPQPTPEQIAAAMLPAAKANVLPHIRAERERRQLADGFPVTLPGVGAVRFHSDAHSRSQHAGLYAAATLTLMQGGTAASPVLDPQTGQPVQWRTMGGAMVPLSVGVLLTLLQASMAREGAVHAAADAHLAAVEALTDPAAVLAYDYSTGWPG